MNATPPVSRAPISIDPAPGGGSPADSARSGVNGQDFAAALGDAGPKPADTSPMPARKAAPAKARDRGSVGQPLPVPGNLAPPPTAPAALASSLAASAAPSTLTGPGPGAANAPAGFARALGPLTVTSRETPTPVLAAPLAKGTPVGQPLPVLRDFAPPPAGSAAGEAAAAALAKGIPVGNAAAGAPLTATAQEIPAPGLAALHAKGTEDGSDGQPLPVPGNLALPPRTAPTAVGSLPAASAAAAAAAPAGLARALGPGLAAPHAKGTEDGGERQAATRSGANTPEGTATSSNDGATANDDATAEPADATALAAAASGALAVSKADSKGAADSPSAPSNDSATPVGGMAQDGNGSGAPPVPAIAIASAAAAAAGTGTAKAQGPAALAGAGTDDKRVQAGPGGSVPADATGNTIAGAAQLSAPAPTTTEASPTPTLKVGAGVETPAFGQGLADRVSWMVDNNLNGAKLQVNPPQLGPIEVRVVVQGDQAQVWLTSHSAVTRDALEASSSKLKEMLGGQGFSQVSVDISQRSFQERSPQAQTYDWTPSADRGESTAPSSMAATPRLSSGALDAYA
jgi:flagellar hook-length control protein FliK